LTDSSLALRMLDKEDVMEKKKGLAVMSFDWWTVIAGVVLAGLVLLGLPALPF
jgi:hypothetical protein